MGENNEDNDPFEEDIVFDQTGLLGRKSPHPAHHQPPSNSLPTFLLFIRVVFLCVTFIGLGLCVAVSQGPLISLEVTFGIPASRAFHIFTAYSFGMLIGGLLGSTLFEVYNRQFLIFISLLWVSASIIVLPFTIVVSYWWTLITIGALGSGLAFIFTGSNVLILDLLGKQRGVGLQCLHFCFAVGALIAALSIRPFLSGISSLGLEPVNSSFASSDVALNSIELERVPRSIPHPLDNHPDQATTPSMVAMQANFTSSSALGGTLNDSNVTLSGAVSEAITQTVTSTTTSPHPQTTDGNEPKTTTFLPSKSPKPKPSFTNANLIPELSKWKRPPPKGVDNPLHKTAPEIEKESAQQGSSSDDLNNHDETSIKGSKDIVQANLNSSVENGEKGSTVAPKTEIIVTTSANEAEEHSTTLLNDNVGQMNDNGSILATESVFSEPPDVDSTILSSNDSTTTPHTTSIAVPTTKVTYPATNPPSTPKKSLTPASSSSTSPIVPHPVLVDRTTIEPKTNNDDQKQANLVPAPKKILAGTTQEVFEVDFSSNHDMYDSDDDYFNYVQEMPPPTQGYSDNSPLLNNEPHLLNLKEPPMSDSTLLIPRPTPQFVTDLPKHQTKPGTYSNFSESNTHFLDTLAANFKNYGITGIHLFYVGIGVAIMILSLISIIFLCRKPREPRSKQEEGCLSNVHRTQLRIFVLLFSLYMFSAEALQGAIHHLLAASHTSDGFPLFTKSVDGQAIFWGLVTAVRFVCILVSGCCRIKPGKILVASTFFMVLGSVLLCIGTFDKKDFLWGGVIVVSLGLAPVLPTCFLWMADYMKVTHRMCALMIVLSSFGNSLTHTSLTYVLANSHLYSYILIGISLLSVAFLTSTFCLLFKSIKKKSFSLPEGYHLASQDDEEGLELSRPHLKDYDHLSHHVNEMGEARQALLID